MALQDVIKGLGRHLSALRTERNPKELWGVGHRDKEEYEAIISRLKKVHPRKVGLKIPEDTLRREVPFTTFFSDIAYYLESKRITCTALDDRALVNNQYAIEMVRAILLGQYSSDELASELAGWSRRLQSLSLAPKVTRRYAEAQIKLAQYTTASGILEKSPSLSGLERQWQDVNCQRESYMHQAIQQTKPDIVIIGIGHIKALEKELKGYSRVKFYDRPVGFLI